MEDIIGNVRWFDASKGYGMIDHPEGDVIVHYSEIQMAGYRQLMAGQEVRYDLRHTEKGLSATNVRPSLVWSTIRIRWASQPVRLRLCQVVS